MILPIYLYGSEVLRQKAAPADLSEKEKITKLVSDMEETLAKSEGCGLAAPQVGESVRILIVDRRDKTSVDKISAAIILQSYLDRTDRN